MKERFIHQLNLTRRLRGLFLLFALMLLPNMALGAFQLPGDGTQGSPYTISDANELYAFSVGVNSGEPTEGLYFRIADLMQTPYIDCSTITEFAPIGTSQYPFKGSFDGNGSNLSLEYLPVTVNDLNGYNGLFGVIDGGTVQNLKLGSCTFTGGKCGGAIVGYLKDGLIEDCEVSNCTIKTGNATTVIAGGIAGYVEKGTINNCTVLAGSVSGISTSADAEISNVGGIVGLAGAVSGTGSITITISSCEVSGAFLQSKLDNVQSLNTGGIVGWCRSGNITLSGNKVSHSGTSYTAISAEEVTSNYDMFYCGAVIGSSGNATLVLSNNTYDYDVTVSTKSPNAEAVVKSGYDQRGRGDLDPQQQVHVNLPDITENNGIVLYTKELSIVGDVTVECDCYEPLSDGQNGKYAFAPGQMTRIILYPKNAVESLTVSLVYTPQGTELTVPQNNQSNSSDYYKYEFEMPYVNAVLNVEEIYPYVTHYYNLWIAGEQVTTDNQSSICENVVGSGHIYFDGDHTLTLDEVPPMVFDSQYPFIESYMDLTINLVGESWFDSGDTFITNSDQNPHTVTFTTDANNPGMLTLQTATDFIGFEKAFENGLTWKPEGYYDVTDPNAPASWVAIPYTAYDLWIGGTQVTSANFRNVLGDNGRTVSFSVTNDPTTSVAINTLTLNGATLTGPITVGLPNLTIDVQGTNSVTVSDGNVIKVGGTLEGAPTVTMKTSTHDGDLTLTSTSLDMIEPGGVFANGMNISIDKSFALIEPTTSYNLTDGSYHTARFVPALGVAIGDIQIYAGNQADVFGDGTVSFAATLGQQGEPVNLLTLNNADLSGAISTSLADLTIELIGNNSLYRDNDGPAIESSDGRTNVKIQSTAETKGSFTMKTWYNGGSFYSNGVNLEIVAPLEVVSGQLTENQGNNNIVVIGVPYGITVYALDNQGDEVSFPVTSQNAHDVLDDGGSVSFTVVQGQINKLTLNNAVIGGSVYSIAYTIPNLTIFLKGSSVMRSYESCFIFVDDPGQQSLRFATDGDVPGSLAFENRLGENFDSGNIFSGMAPTYLNPLSMIHKTKSWVIGVSNTEYLGTTGGLDPITDKDDPTVTLPVDNSDGEYNYLDGVTIGEVHYTLSADQGYYDPSDDVPGVRILVGMTDDEVLAATFEGDPGDPDFDSRFRGITLKAPAGVGKVSVYVKAEPGAVLRVKVGDEDPYSPTVSQTSYDPIEIEYAVEEDTYIYIYLLDQEPNTSRANGPRHEKVQHTSVKVTGYSGKSSALFTSTGGNNTAAIYDLSCVGYTPGHTSITMSSVSTASASSAAPARAKDAPMQSGSAPVTNYTINEVGNDVFKEIPDKSIIRFIDMKGTAVQGMTVNRSEKVFAGFGENTFIYLPTGNNSGSEPNVVVGDVCSQMTLDEGSTFQAPADLSFTAQNVQFNRTFTVGKRATLFLPISITADKIEALGKVYSLQGVTVDGVLFGDVGVGIIANTPYIFEPKVSTFAAAEVEVVGNGKTTANEGELFGTYEPINWTTDPDDIYGFAAEDLTDGSGVKEGEFFKVKAGSFIRPFRAYIKTAGAPSRLRVIIQGDEQTGITTISDDATDGEAWYSIDGRRMVGKPTKQGMYIHNNQKVIVK